MVDKIKTKEMVTSFFYECFNFWSREGRPVIDAKKAAFRDCQQLQHDPYCPCGDELDPVAKEEALKTLSKLELRE